MREKDMRRGVKGIYNSTDWLMPADIRTSIPSFRPL